MRMIFIGPPGAGKGTQSARLIAYLGVPHLSTGEIFRQAQAAQTDVGLLAAKFIDAGGLVPDPVVVAVVGDRLLQPDCQSGCLFDGFPRTIGQAQSLDEYLREIGAPLDLVLELRVPEDVLVERMLARGRGDDNPGIIRRRLAEYNEQTQPVLEYYGKQGLVRVIDGTGTPDEVFERIQTAVDATRRKKK